MQSYHDILMQSYKDNSKIFYKNITKYLKGKKLGTMPIENINLDYQTVNFSTKVDELQLDWMLVYNENKRKDKIVPEVHISVSSPNKPNHSYAFTVTGRNASPQGVWNAIEKKYKSM